MLSRVSRWGGESARVLGLPFRIVNRPTAPIPAPDIGRQVTDGYAISARDSRLGTAYSATWTLAHFGIGEEDTLQVSFGERTCSERRSC